MELKFSQALCVIFAVVMAGSALASAPLPSTDATPHNYWFAELTGSDWQRIRDTSADATNPNGGVTRYWVRDTPTEVNTNVAPLGGLPYPGMSDTIGASGQSAVDYCSMVQTYWGQAEPTNGEECIFIMEMDKNVATTPRVYMNNGVQIGGVPHGYIWAGNDSHDAYTSDQEVLPSGDPPTKYFELLEMAAPQNSGSYQFSWLGVNQPSDVAGDVNGQIESWGLMESTDTSGPWTEVGKAAFGSTITYSPGMGLYICVVPYYKGDVRGLVYSQINYYWQHWDAYATGPEGTTTSLGPFNISYFGGCTDGFLYYSHTSEGPWIKITDISWGGSASYSWTAPGYGTYYWLAVAGCPDPWLGYDPPPYGAGAEAGPYIIEATSVPFAIPVQLGWNLVSLPIDLPSLTLPAQLLDGDVYWNRILAYNSSSPSNNWQQFSTDWDFSLNEISRVEVSQGFWIYVTNAGDGYLNLTGNEVSATSIGLNAGWNLVGYPSMTNRTVADAFWGTGVDIVEVFDAGQPYLTSAVGASYVMTPGKGYWVHVNVDMVWTVDW